MRTQTMRIEAGLLTYLWNELIKTAGYIANQTPMRKHGWKTPFEKVIGTAPNLSHLQKIGCKAYALNKHIFHKQKLKKRAHIGHLMGYDSTNIFCIWISSQRKIICTQDIQFDKSSFYNLAILEPNLSQVTLKLMVPVTYAVSLLNFAIQITKIETDEDELNFLTGELNFGTGEEKDNSSKPERI